VCRTSSDYKPTGDRHLRFRRLTTVVEVTAPSEEAVRRFASMFLAELTRAGDAAELQETSDEHADRLGVAEARGERR
jgi:hypothetical protein